MSTTLTKWAIDTAHSEINFKAKHLMITNVTGTFKSYSAEIETEGNDLSTAKIKFEADIASIDTGNEQRDGHLKSDDFFNAEAFPKLTFVGKSVKNASSEGFELTGDLTIRDVTREVVLNVEIGGVKVDPWGNTKAGLTFSGKLNRKDFGLKFHVVTEAGDLLVSDEIRLLGDIQLATA
jgi:polyisoprenoid-binding protein YceI